MSQQRATTFISIIKGCSIQKNDIAHWHSLHISILPFVIIIIRCLQSTRGHYITRWFPSWKWWILVVTASFVYCVISNNGLQTYLMPKCFTFLFCPFYEIIDMLSSWLDRFLPQQINVRIAITWWNGLRKRYYLY